MSRLCDIRNGRAGNGFGVGVGDGAKFVGSKVSIRGNQITNSLEIEAGNGGLGNNLAMRGMTMAEDETGYESGIR